MSAENQVLDCARATRDAGFVASLRLGGTGMASPGVIRFAGRDALSFIHSQVTNQVETLDPGCGNESALLNRQGQLIDLFNLYRLPDEVGSPVLWLLAEAERVPSILAEFGNSHFSDEVTITDLAGEHIFIAVQGSHAGRVLDEVAPLEAGPWSEVDRNAVVSMQGEGVPEGSLALSNSLIGDPGLLLVLPVNALGVAPFEAKIRESACSANLIPLEEPMLSEVLEVLRIEAGVVRVGPDTQGRKRILPETGLEQERVSYTKGCYLGQEVIARVRTYGALPYGLRGLVFDAAGMEAQQALLAALPEPGEALVLDDGTKAGQWASRTFSSHLDAAVAYAYLDKSHRTPGGTLSIQIGGGLSSAEIRMLPFYSTPGAGERVAWLYDRGVREFAGGRENEALDLLTEALRLDPGFADGYEAMGVILGRTERFHEAIDIFKQLEEIAPQEPMVNTNLSLYFMKIGDKESAEEEAARALQKDMARNSGHDFDAEGLDQVLAEQQRADAERKKAMFGQVLEIDPEDPIALFGLGNALSALADWDSAAEVYGRAAAAEKNNSAVYLAHGKALEQLGRAQEASKIYREGMDVASRKGDLMPLKEMEHRVLLLSGAEIEATIG